MSLAEYKRKRSFSRTPEPEGKATRTKAKKDQLLFVVQKHHASHLHYDFRLELKGALKSWAVPKGPSMNPNDKRLAMLVEDHPFDYKDFEGVIPKGNYGAGTVIIWDQGTYEPAEPAKTKAENEKLLIKAFYSGQLKIKLKGKKLKGEFVLVRSQGREENAWLLIKKKDEVSAEIDISKKNKSVVSGKTLEQVAADKTSKHWISNRSSNGELKEDAEVKERSAATTKKAAKEKTSAKKAAKAKGRTAKRSSADKSAEDDMAVNYEPIQSYPSASTEDDKDYDEIIAEIFSKLTKKKRSPMPRRLIPMQATLTDKPFDKPDWIYEVKWDGYRALAYLDNGKVELRSRNNNSFNEKFFPVYEALKEWPIKAVIDGEIVVVDEKGLSAFSKLEGWQAVEDGQLEYYVFDILWLNGISLMELPLLERREILQQLVPENDIIRFSESFAANGTEFFKSAEKLGIEGIVAKQANSIYRPDVRTKDWLKIKTEQRHEAVIAGYTFNEGSDKQFSALILGVYENGELKFIGQAGTGFTKKTQTELLKKLKPLQTRESPFKEEPVINKPTRFRANPPKTEVFWVKPELVCQVKYQELKPEGIMRHASFQGLREDKAPVEVKEEQAVPAPSDKKEKAAAEKTENTASGKKQKKASGKKEKTAPAEEKRTKPTIKKTGGPLLDPGIESEEKNIDGHIIRFTNLNKIYWPAEELTKRDMLNYYHAVAPHMLQYMKDRPQSLNRHPNGIKGKNFFQKDVAGKVDDWLTTHYYENTTREGIKTFLVCTDEASLMYMANMGCIEMNPWHSRTSSPDNPDWCVIDLDPDNNPFDQVIEAANVIRKILAAANIPSYPKTSGSTGMHIYIPLGAKYSYDQSKDLAELIVTLAHQEISGFTSLERNPDKRKGKIYLDFLQNRATQTLAAPYSVRPKAGATVSTPLHWDEVKKGLSIKDFTILNVPSRLKAEGDLFKGLLGKGIDLEKVLKKISSVFG
jgi:bifunctional non-homologous end joining protein LigD